MNLRHNITYLSIFIILLNSFGLVELKSQNISEEVLKAFRAGDAVLLSKYFSESLTINVAGEESEMTAEEASERMERFFRSSAVKNFYIKFRGEKSRSNFMIGTLETGKGTYRVNIFFKNLPEGKKIHLLRIEKEDESSF